MGIIKTEEFEKDGCIYIRNTYNNGTIEEYIKTDESTLPEPTQPPVTNEDILNAMQARHVQRGHTELNGVSVVIPLELIDVSKATVQLDVQGCDAPYAYTLAEDALTVTFAEPGQAWINWEVRG